MTPNTFDEAEKWKRRALWLSIIILALLWQNCKLKQLYRAELYGETL